MIKDTDLDMGEIILDYLGGPSLITESLKQSTFPDWVTYIRWKKEVKFEVLASTVAGFENVKRNHKPKKYGKLLDW